VAGQALRILIAAWFAVDAVATQSTPPVSGERRERAMAALAAIPTMSPALLIVLARDGTWRGSVARCGASNSSVSPGS
jgi:hypothetical protein